MKPMPCRHTVEFEIENKYSDQEIKNIFGVISRNIQNRYRI